MYAQIFSLGYDVSVRFMTVRQKAQQALSRAKRVVFPVAALLYALSVALWGATKPYLRGLVRSFGLWLVSMTTEPEVAPLPEPSEGQSVKVEVDGLVFNTLVSEGRLAILPLDVAVEPAQVPETPAPVAETTQVGVAKTARKPRSTASKSKSTGSISSTRAKTRKSASRSMPKTVSEDTIQGS